LTQFPSLQKSEQPSSSHSTQLSERNSGVACSKLNGLQSTIERHVSFERASFHTPGHKGRLQAETGSAASKGQDQKNTGDAGISWQYDVTELPGLDDLSNPQGILRSLETNAAALWQAGESVLSVNGASAGLMAAVLSLADSDGFLLVPRNAHRSIVNGLVLSGLEPIWYEPIWDDVWGLWTSVNATAIAKALETRIGKIAGVVVVSPTYGGALSDIKAIADVCHGHRLPLIVDEAHGAHLIPGSAMPQSAIVLGADIVVQSLHKTLSGSTQTGITHIGRQSLVSSDHFRACQRLVQTTSPSYLLLSSIERVINEMTGLNGLAKLASLTDLSIELDAAINAIAGMKTFTTKYGTDPLHLLVTAKSAPAEELNQFLMQRGIFAEAVIGDGLLFMLGVGSSLADAEILLELLRDFVEQAKTVPGEGERAPARSCSFKRFDLEQVMTPRKASLMPSRAVPIEQAADCIAAECVAPCPPGVPLCVPGQRLTKEVLNHIPTRQIRVVNEDAIECVQDRLISATEISNGNNSSR
jgi:arginine decarboxylase